MRSLLSARLIVIYESLLYLKWSEEYFGILYARSSRNLKHEFSVKIHEEPKCNKPENPFQTMTSQLIRNIYNQYAKNNFPTLIIWIRPPEV